MSTLVFLVGAFAAGQVHQGILNAYNSAVSIVGEDRAHECGGGVVNIAGQFVVLTASHCVKDPEQVYAVSTGGYTYKLKLEKVLHVPNTAIDVAILTHDSLETRFSALAIASSLVVGDDLYMWQQPLQVQLLLTRGLYGGLTDTGWANIQRAHYVDIPSAPGSSGSILLNEYGEIVGVYTLGLNHQTTLPGGFFITIWEILELIEDVN